MSEVVERNVVINETLFSLVITEEWQGIRAMTAIHTQTHPWRQGGTRFVASGSRTELAHLALGMSEKSKAARVPVDGMKCVIACSSGVPKQSAARAEILAKHIRTVRKYDPLVVFGPDMGCQEDVLDALFGQHDLRDNLTGLSRANGGFDIDKNGFTAMGIIAGLDAIDTSAHARSVAIQGFGAVGANLARMLDPLRYSIAAISNAEGTLHDCSGIEVPRLLHLHIDHGDGALAAYAQTVASSSFSTAPTKLFDYRADILVPAARTSVLALNAEIPHVVDENPETKPVEQLFEAMQPRIIAEAANRPLTPAAECYLSNRGVYVLPDILINCGGLIGCWIERRDRGQLIRGGADYERAYNACISRIQDTVRRNLCPIAAKPERHFCYERGVAAAIVAAGAEEEPMETVAG